MECSQAAVRFDPRLRGLHERVSRRKGSGCATVAVVHEMARTMYFMLVRDEPYRESDVGLTERKLKSFGKKAFDGLRT